MKSYLKTSKRILKKLTLQPKVVFYKMDRILANYSAFLQDWSFCLKEKLQLDIRVRTVGCQPLMNIFDLFFGLNLGEHLFSHAETLLKMMQKRMCCEQTMNRLAYKKRFCKRCVVMQASNLVMT